VITSGDRAAEIVRQQPEAIVAQVAGARRGLLHGALDAPTVHQLFSLIAGAGTVALKHGELHGLREPAFDAVRGQAGDADLTPALPAIDRANTSVRLAERFQFKLVRRVEPGVSQEVEIGRFLTESEHFPRVPLLTGTIEYRPGSGHSLFATTASTVAVLHSFVPHQMDGWRQALGELGRYLEAATTWEEADALLPAGVDLWTTPIPERARRTIGAYLESAATLGRRTAELHHALTSDAAARSLGTSVLDQSWSAAFAANFHAAASAVLDIVEGIPTGSSAKPFAAVAPTREKLAARIDALVAALPAGIQLSRVHGAYDLEQVLLSEGDFKIIDFEGDPSRSLHERKQQDTPMRDVASMARSFHYAASFEFSARAALTPQDRGRLAIWAEWWRMWVTASFLQGWRGAAAGAAFLPEDLDATRLLFDAMRLRKVLSEIRHEAAQRPEHLWIPLEMLAVIGSS
jgi:maltose alpha-D-glucosyltransferase/alpha-amylase